MALTTSPNADLSAESGRSEAFGASIESLADRCVKCGLCLPQCPTYALDRNEAESPRGRINLARALADGSLTASSAADLHLDQCLGCLRCEAVCPAGVEYGELLQRTRSVQRQRRGAGLRQRMIEWLATHPRLLDRMLGLYRAVYPLAPKPLPRPPRAVGMIAPAAPSTSGQPSSAQTVALFRGCVARRYDAVTQVALTRLCTAAGVIMIEPSAQTCCGALHAHAGNLDAASALAQCNRAAFATAIPVLSSASGCHDSLLHALDGHAPVRDAQQFLLQHVDALRFRPANRTVALHIPCTQRSVVRSDDATRQLLAKIPQLRVIELADSGCCGAAGSHMLEFPERAVALRAPLLEAFRASGTDSLLTSNIGCRLHLQNGLRDATQSVSVLHPLSLLADYLDTSSLP